MLKYILTVLILFISSYSFSNESDLTISQQLERLQREVTDLSKEVFSNPSNQSSGTNNDFVKNLSAIDLRIYDIENDIKNLTSNLEDLYLIPYYKVRLIYLYMKDYLLCDQLFHYK